MVAAARPRAAASLGALVSVAVVDAGGHLVCFERMDGAEIAGPVLAPTRRTPPWRTGPPPTSWPRSSAPGGAAGRHAGRGRRPVRLLRRRDARCGPAGRVVAGVGVSGGTAEQDLAAAAAAARVYEATEADAVIGRFRFMDAQRVNLDGFAVEDAGLGLIAFDSPADPEPSLVLGADGTGRSRWTRGRPPTSTSLDEFIARHGLDLDVAAEAMALDDVDFARMMVDPAVPARRGRPARRPA